jgi:tetratricopeptide (TPR) repeat protein
MDKPDATPPEPSTRVGDQVRSTPNDSTVQAQIATMKREIDALQISFAEADKPWYKQASILIAALALLFSFGTTYYSEQRTRKADIHNAKVELRQLIQQLTELPQRNLDLNRKYADNPTALLTASALINTQHIVLSKQAVDIVDEIPERVSSTEYFAIANALATAGSYDRTIEFYRRSLDKAQDANDWTAASRSLAQTAFTVGDLQQGRASYQESLNVFNKFPTRNPYFIWYTNTYTEILWAGAELGQRQCSHAKDHLDKAEKSLSTVPSQGGDPRFSAQLKALRKSFLATCPQR